MNFVLTYWKGGVKVGNARISVESDLQDADRVLTQIGDQALEGGLQWANEPKFAGRDGVRYGVLLLDETHRDSIRGISTSWPDLVIGYEPEDPSMHRPVREKVRKTPDEFEDWWKQVDPGNRAGEV